MDRDIPVPLLFAGLLPFSLLLPSPSPEFTFTHLTGPLSSRSSTFLVRSPPEAVPLTPAPCTCHAASLPIPWPPLPCPYPSPVCHLTRCFSAMPFLRKMQAGPMGNCMEGQGRGARQQAQVGSPSFLSPLVCSLLIFSSAPLPSLAASLGFSLGPSVRKL